MFVTEFHQKLNYGSTQAIAVSATSAATSTPFTGSDPEGRLVRIATTTAAWIRAIPALVTVAAGTTDGKKLKIASNFEYEVSGARYSKSAPGEFAFSHADVVTTAKFGVWLVQINAAGTVSTKAPSTTMAYADAGTALAALPSPDAGNRGLASVVIGAGGADWTANTDTIASASTASYASITQTNSSSDSTMIPAGTAEVFRVKCGDLLAAVRVSADGTLTVTEFE